MTSGCEFHEADDRCVHCLGDEVERLREALDAVHGTALAGLAVDPRGALEHVVFTVNALSRTGSPLAEGQKGEPA